VNLITLPVYQREIADGAGGIGFPPLTPDNFFKRDFISNDSNYPLFLLNTGGKRMSDSMKLIAVLVFSILIAGIFIAGCTSSQPVVTPVATPTPTIAATPLVYSQGELDMKLQMRQLWTDHAVWTRMYIIESLDNSPAADAAAARLLKNQEDIGNAIKPVYGDAAGNQLTALLKQHILIAVDIINDVKAKNSTAQAADEARWKSNADDISNFLSAANPTYWPGDAVRNMMYMHLSTTKDELVARATQNYPADVTAWDAVYTHILTMSDALSDGVIKQNPAKFAGPKMYSQNEVDLRNNMRKLWTDHTVWTRCYIIESIYNSKAADPAAARLLQNQVDIGNAIKPVYGDAAGTQLSALLKQHILIAVNIINDVKAKNATAQAADEAQWKNNADDISNFLSAANPNWPNDVVKNMMYMHLSTTKDELVARVTQDYTGDVKAWDAVYAHILAMSDALSGGIVKQFPANFGK
jgi:hypothetical protein